jgi:hypothetical protein
MQQCILQNQPQKMKKSLITIFSLLVFSTASFSQDIITPVSGKDIPAIILEIDSTQIRYKKFNVKNAADTIIQRADVVMIDFEDGTKRLFNPDKLKKEVELPIVTNPDFYAMGEKDALKYYKGYQPAGTATLITTLLFSPAGLVPAFACSSKPPAYYTLKYPNADLMKNPEYFNGYTKKAHHIKAKKIWTNFGIALGFNIGLGITLYRSR